MKVKSAKVEQRIAKKEKSEELKQKDVQELKAVRK